MPFDAFDTNGDGLITQEEFMQAHAQRQAIREEQGGSAPGQPAPQKFIDFDTDGNGVLNQAELAAGQMANQQGRPGMKNPGWPSGQGRGLGRGRNMPSFADFDVNQDGIMTEDEFIEGRGKRISERAQQGYLMRGLQYARPFSEIDTDGDGQVNPAEFAAAQAQHRQNPHGQ
jgi:Ca2+-binding EF-hand superfamily protein